MTYDDHALTFDCGGHALYGVLSVPRGGCERGVLIVVGGPQYRAGSHRQFTLLARHLAANGIAALRFDYRGMGDSEGEPRAFDAVGDDVRAALDAFMAAVPGMRDVVLWGLCDAASAIAMYAADDARVAGLILLNPWVHTEGGAARATLKHYYRGRLFDPAFWRKLASGRFDVAGSLKSMLTLVRTALRARAPVITPASAADRPFIERMRDGLRAFGGPVLVIVGGADLTGREFCDLGEADPAWRALLAGPRVTRRLLDRADHTFSRRAWRDQVADWTQEWIGGI
jgi:exosortase A-associated hydrolase 1